MTGLTKRGWLAGALVPVALLIAACGDERAVADAEPVNELEKHDGTFCPKTLPRAPEDTYGFGTYESAEAAPSLWAPEEAWICQYVTRDIASSGANGAWYDWVRHSAPRQLDDQELKAFAGALEQLRPPPDGDYGCNDDLGPRYLVSYVYENDLTGVVIDDFGCQHIRLTDDPFQTVPGEAAPPGVVAGVLFGPDDILSKLNV